MGYTSSLVTTAHGVSLMTNDEYLRSLTPGELDEWFKARHDDSEVMWLKRKVARLEDANAILAEQLHAAINGWHEANRGWAEALMRI